MKAIRFRAWERPDVPAPKGYAENKDFKGAMHYDIQDATYFGEWIHDPGYIVMQWTGFVDRMGMKIYEGDIVRFQEGAMMPINLLVKWQNVGWEPFNSYSDIFRSGYKPEHHLVMGNIYQQPDMEYQRKGE